MAKQLNSNVPCTSDTEIDGLWACACKECAKLQHESNREMAADAGEKFSGEYACDCSKCDPSNWGL